MVRELRLGRPSIVATRFCLSSSCGSMITTLAPELLRLPASSSNDEVDDEFSLFVDEVPFFNDGLMGFDPDCGIARVGARF